jgi:hypothetical protein
MLTLDGNFQLNLYRKRNGTDDRSVWNGDGYFPLDEALRDYLQRCSENQEASAPSYTIFGLSKPSPLRNRRVATSEPLINRIKANLETCRSLG